MNKKILISAIALVTIMFTLVSFVSAHTGNDEFDHCSGFCPMMSGNYGFGPMLFGWAFSILVLVVLILFIIWLIKQIQKSK